MKRGLELVWEEVEEAKEVRGDRPGLVVELRMVEMELEVIVELFWAERCVRVAEGDDGGGPASCVFSEGAEDVSGERVERDLGVVRLGVEDDFFFELLTTCHSSLPSPELDFKAGPSFRRLGDFDLLPNQRRAVTSSLRSCSEVFISKPSSLGNHSSERPPPSERDDWLGPKE